MKRVVDPRIMSQESLLDLLGFRVALEIGISSDIFHNIKEQDIMELEEIVNAGVALGNNEYANLSEYTFHSKLYEITGNKTIVQFQSIIHPVMNFVKNQFEGTGGSYKYRTGEKGKDCNSHRFIELYQE